MILAKKLTKSVERLEPTEILRDILGREFKVGQYVAVSGSRMSIGQIKRVTPKMVSVEIVGPGHFKGYSSTYLKFPGEMVILDGPDIFMWILANGL